MQIISILALLFALVFGVIAFGSMMTLNADISDLASGGLQSLVAIFPTMWIIFVGGIAVAGVVVAVGFMMGR